MQTQSATEILITRLLASKNLSIHFWETYYLHKKTH